MNPENLQLADAVTLDLDAGTLTIHMPREVLLRIQDRIQPPEPMDPPVKPQPYDAVGSLKPLYMPRGGVAGEGGDIVITIGPIISIQPQPPGPKDPKPGGIGITISFDR